MGPLSIALSQGASGAENPTGRYRAGDNPIIEVRLPAEIVDGYLWVVMADADDTLYNLVPNQQWPVRDQPVGTLGTVEDGVRRVRVAFSVAEVTADPGRFGFEVGAPFGTSLVAAFLTEPPLFPDNLPKLSNTGFAELLAPRLASDSVQILSVSTQFIDTER